MPVFAIKDSAGQVTVEVLKHTRLNAVVCKSAIYLKAAPLEIPWLYAFCLRHILELMETHLAALDK